MAQLLLVEDNAAAAALICQYMKALYSDHQITICATATDAFDWAGKHHIDLFILDIQLPDYRGTELGKHIRAMPEYRFTPILFTTELGGEELAAYREIKCYDFLIKPFTQEQFLRAVSTALDMGQQMKKPEPILRIEQKQFLFEYELKQIRYIESFGKRLVIHSISQGEDLADQISVPRFSTDLPEFAEAEKAVQAKIDKFMSIQGNESVDSIHKKLGHIMWEYVGMGRTAEGLKKGIAALKEIRKEFETNLFIPGSKEGMNVELDKAIRLYDFITMGELVAYDALNRNESCGGHFREEYQTEEGEAKRDDENFFYVACWEYQGDDEKAPVLIKEPLVYEAIKVQTRNYKS